MRKRIGAPHDAQQGDQSDEGWLDLEQIATVEVTSEDPRFPIEYAFGSNDGPGWRASQSGEQQIRIIFDKPVSVHRIELRFHEADCERTQEFILRWSSESGGPATEIVR
ncbi:MAG: carbohydrate-binding protein, partial [Bryobacterales bacterium]|nr:carbohydrate-binding protein [Bryobacterales bacterium]